MKTFTFTKLGRALLVAAVVLSMGCGGGSGGELVGQWVNVVNNGAIDLFKDGTGVAGGESFTWKVEGNRFVFADKNTTVVSEYTLEGYEFTRTFANGGKAVWVRRDKLEEYKKKKAEEKIKEEELAKKEAEKRFEKISSYFTDSRNGQKYRAVKIGGKTWMAENLNYPAGNSWCYENDESNCKIYGRLYDWKTARMACPAGYHLPSVKEWDELAVAGGGQRKSAAFSGIDEIFYWNNVGGTLKSTSGWNDADGKSGNGTDEFGFSALPGGVRLPDGTFSSAGDNGNWWSATEVGSGSAFTRDMNSGVDFVSEGNFVKSLGLSVRCLQD